MKRDNRQILVNPHSSLEKIPAGVLNLGEIGVQHNNVEDAALYVETVADSESASTVAKFITEKAIDNKIDDALSVMVNDLQNEIDGINEAVGLPHEESGATPWGTGSSVWDAIETVYAEMTAGTAAANTKVIANNNDDTNNYMTLTAQTDASTSSITYTIGLKGIKDGFDSVNEAIEDVADKVYDLSAATKDVLDALDYTGVTQEGKPIVNVSQEDGLINAETGRINSEYVDYDSAHTLDQVLETIIENIEANEVESSDGSIVVDNSGDKTGIKVNIDEHSIVLNDNNELVADLKLSAITPSNANVKEEYALVNHVGEQLGESIKVYKDSSLYNVYLGHVDDAITAPDDPTVVPGSGDTALCFIYEKADSTYELVAVDVNDFLEESEFQDGLEVDNHIVKVKVDPSSEEVEIASGVTAPVLSVSADGVKVDNIQAAIDYAVSDLAGNINADVTGTSSDGHVTVEVVQENTELTGVVVTTDDIASAEELDKVEEAVGLASDGSFVADTANTYTSAATSVRDEIHLLDDALKEVNDKLDAASVEEGASFENFVSLNITDDGQGATAITIDDTELKQTIDLINEDIANEIAAREEAIEELIGNSASTSADTSIMGVKEYVKETVEELSANAVQEVAFAAVSTKDETAYGSNAGVEVVDGENGKKINLDLSLLKIDCGEY